MMVVVVYGPNERPKQYAWWPGVNMDTMVSMIYSYRNEYVSDVWQQMSAETQADLIFMYSCHSGVFCIDRIDRKISFHFLLNFEEKN